MLQWLFLSVEILFAAAVLVGIWLIFPPAALIVGGAGGIWAIERSLGVDAARKRAATPRVAPQVRRMA